MSVNTAPDLGVINHAVDRAGLGVESVLLTSVFLSCRAFLLFGGC